MRRTNNTNKSLLEKIKVFKMYFVLWQSPEEEQ